MDKYIAFDIGGTNIKHAVLLEDGTVMEKDKYPTRKDALTPFIKDVVSVVRIYQEKYEIAGIAVSMPGFVDVKTGYTDRAGSLTILDGQNLKTLLEAEVPYTVEIENDGNCAALAEKLDGNATECRDFICITIGTGIGGGIFLNNRIYHGHQFRSGEVGFMLTPGSKSGREIWSANGSTSGLVNSYKEQKALNAKEQVEGEHIFEEAKENQETKQLVENWLERISYGIYNIAGTLNPEKILIGGGVSAQQNFAGKIQNHLEKQVGWDYIRVPVEVCKYKNEAGMLGALKHFLIQKEDAD